MSPLCQSFGFFMLLDQSVHLSILHMLNLLFLIPSV
jgi:hypothetical protein